MLSSLFLKVRNMQFDQKYTVHYVLRSRGFLEGYTKKDIRMEGEKSCFS